MLRTASIIGFVPVRDMQEAEGFFGGRLGLAAVKRGASALVPGVENGQALRCVPVPGGDAQVLWFNDPSGNVLSLSEHMGKAQAR